MNIKFVATIYSSAVEHVQSLSTLGNRICKRTSNATCKASYTWAHQMVREPLTNGLRTKCVYVWMGLRTCAVPSANGSHTVRRKPKFVVFFANTKRTGCAGCPSHAPSVLCSPQVRRKLMNCAPLTHCTACKWHTCVYKA